jgi:hypothetical protein
MMSINPKPWLAIGTLVLLLSTFSVAQRSNAKRGSDIREQRHSRQVPDGGAAASYLLTAGAACLGALVIRSRFRDPHKS